MSVCRVWIVGRLVRRRRQDLCRYSLPYCGANSRIPAMWSQITPCGSAKSGTRRPTQLRRTQSLLDHR